MSFLRDHGPRSTLLIDPPLPLVLGGKRTAVVTLDRRSGGLVFQGAPPPPAREVGDEEGTREGTGREEVVEGAGANDVEAAAAAEQVVVVLDSIDHKLVERLDHRLHSGRRRMRSWWPSRSGERDESIPVLIFILLPSSTSAPHALVGSNVAVCGAAEIARATSARGFVPHYVRRDDFHAPNGAQSIIPAMIGCGARVWVAITRPRERASCPRVRSSCPPARASTRLRRGHTRLSPNAPLPRAPLFKCVWEHGGQLRLRCLIELL